MKSSLAASKESKLLSIKYWLQIIGTAKYDPSLGNLK